MKPLPRSFYLRPAPVVGPELLGKVLVRGPRSGRIVEVEAYCGRDDPGSHAFRGRTERNAAMFGPGGRLYVYRSYGVHWCANVVCGPDGLAQAVLVRALVPLSGLDAMRAARSQGQRRPLADRDLCRGPGRLCQALGISAEDDGADLVAGERGLAVIDDGFPPPVPAGVSVRVGLTKGADHPWRFFVPAEGHVSGPRRLTAGARSTGR